MSDNVKICGAGLRKKPGRVCQVSYGLYPNGRCRYHGGKSMPGIAHPLFKHGKYTKHLPGRLVASYEETKTDPELLELNDEIALVHARAVDLIKRVDSGESGHLWKKLSLAYAELVRAETGPEQLLAIQDLGQLIRQGSADYAAWEDVGRQVDRKQRLIESQRKRAQELQHNMPLDQLNFILGALLSAIVKYVADRDTRAAIQAEFNRILSISHQPGAAA